ncbi:hypothetical protein C8R43DRAFT_315706 [Mycena crocata]|nr:hypothetical protein C8R43DRAFT_315706 [Mycena crocata]
MASAIHHCIVPSVGKPSFLWDSRWFYNWQLFGLAHIAMRLLRALVAALCATSVACATGTFGDARRNSIRRSILTQERYSPDAEQELGRLSNAQRLARRLPLKKPYTRTGSAPRALSSLTSWSGVIQIVDIESNAILGWVGDTETVVASQSSASTFKASLPSSSNTVIELIRTTNNRRLGLLADTSSDRVIGAGSFRYLSVRVLNNGFTTSANSQPVATGSDFAETTIWSVNFATQALSAQWVNQGGTKPTTYLFVSNNKLRATGSITEYVADSGAAATAVKLVLV